MQREERGENQAGNKAGRQAGRGQDTCRPDLVALGSGVGFPLVEDGDDGLEVMLGVVVKQALGLFES